MLKAVMYTALGSLMTWCWLMGHNYWWGALGFLWCLLMATDVIEFCFPKRRGVEMMKKLKPLMLMLSGYALTKLPENNGWWNLIALVGFVYVMDQLFSIEKRF